MDSNCNKRNRQVLAAITCWLLLTTTSLRADPKLEADLRKVLAKLPHASAVVGACVIDLASDRVVYAQNADAGLTPASTMKLFAMTAALTELGPQFAFETILAADSVNLVIIGDGDPGFGDEKLHKHRKETIAAPFERWADALRQNGLTLLPGDIIIDETIFDDQRLHPTWERADLDNWYAAPVGGLNYNDNCLDFVVTPAKTRNAPPLISVRPDTTLPKILNKCQSGGKGTPILHHAFDTMEYTVSGRCRKRYDLGSVSFPDPVLLFADSMRQTLSRAGVTIHGSIRRARVRRPDGTLPSSLSIVARHRTPLADVLGRSGKDSQNMFAECLLKRTGYAWARHRGLPDPRGSWKLGSDAVMDFLHRAGIDTRGLIVADGSGLSRHNSCTARQLTTMLAWSYRQPFGPVLLDSLATAGVDGSLRKRLKDSDGRVHAKTGTMRGIRALAGYVDSDAGPRYAFAVLFNGYSGGSAPYKAIQDRFCRILADACEPRAGTR